MVRFCSSFRWFVIAGAVLLQGADGQSCALAQRPGFSGDPSGPRYQRRGQDSHDWRGGNRRGHNNSFHFNAPAVSSGWFQRPYPYHLDYYRMKYGGSYAPYFGNLYGPPQVVTAPPYFGPYYGNFDYGTPYGLNAPVPFEQPRAEFPPYAGGGVDGPLAAPGVAEEADAESDGEEALPVASP